VCARACVRERRRGVEGRAGGARAGERGSGGERVSGGGQESESEQESGRASENRRARESRRANLPAAALAGREQAFELLFVADAAHGPPLV